MRRIPGQMIYIGIKGTVLAIDRATGSEVWRSELKGSDFVNVLLDGGDLLASTRGEVFCLDPLTGRVRWNNGLKGLGWGLVTMATATGSSGMAAMGEYRRQEEAAAATT